MRKVNLLFTPCQKGFAKTPICQQNPRRICWSHDRSDKKGEERVLVNLNKIQLFGKTSKIIRIRQMSMTVWLRLMKKTGG